MTLCTGNQFPEIKLEAIIVCTLHRPALACTPHLPNGIISTMADFLISCSTVADSEALCGYNILAWWQDDHWTLP